MTDTGERAGWAERLKRLATRGFERAGGCEALVVRARGEDASAEARAALASSFSDERRNRRSVDGLILGRLLDVREPDRGARDGDVGFDARLFASLVDGDERVPRSCVESSGPMVPFDPDVGIERWTQTELGALHAMGVWASRGVGAGRVMDAARWHVEELQPDNATNHAWALHVFVELGLSGEGDGLLHAQTLMHNAMVAGGGAPDVFSSVLLLDAALVLEGGPWRDG
ncbi:MAG: hypothetical protein AAF297_10295 [Planctomycetota bacterium]